MFDKIKDLIAKYRAGDWKGAVKLILALIGDGIDMFTPSAEPTATAYSSMSADALVCELEKMNAKLDSTVEMVKSKKPIPRPVAEGPIN